MNQNVPILHDGNKFCGVVPLNHGLDLLLELGLPPIDLVNSWNPDAFPHPVVGLHLLQGYSVFSPMLSS